MVQPADVQSPDSSPEPWRALRHLASALCVLDGDGRYIYVNSQLLALHGYTDARALLGRPFLVPLRGAQPDRSGSAERLGREVVAALQRDGSYQGPVPATAAGSVPVPGPALQLWGSALDDGGYVVALSRGVTAAAPRVDLRASYARLVDENDVVVFFSHTLDGSLVHANRAAARALGLPPLQLRGQRLAEFIAPGAEEQLAAYLTTLDGAGSARAILTLRSADGAPRVWLCSGTVESLGAEGGLVRALALDTSELAQAEEALRATEDRYWRSLERGADAIWVFDGRDGACLYVNQRACALLQRDRSQISGRRLGEFMSGDVDAGKGPDGGSHLVRLRRADGSDVPVELRIVDLGDGTWQASGRDVTAWLETQRTLRESEARFRRIVETPSRGIFVAERSGRLRFHNAEFGNLLGATATLAQRQLAELVTEPDRAALGDTLAALAPDRSAAIEFQAPHPAKGPRTLRLTLTRTGEEILGEAVDLTEQRALEERVRQAQRLDSVGNLAAGISHDFNNYLTVIQTNLDEAARAAALEAQPPLRTARDAVRAAAELAQQLLAIGRATGEPLRPVPLAPLVADVYRLLQHTLGNAVDLRADVAPDLAVRGSPTQLRQVLINLALNAAEAMPQGGTLTIRARQALQTELPQEFTPRSEAHLLVEVADTGEGMDPPTAARMFDPFFTTKPDSGTGLGGAVVYGIVREHSGALSVDSQPGRGTVVRVWLPAASEASATAGTPPLPERVAPPADPRRARPLTVLVVDDIAPLRQAAASILERAGHTALLAGSGDEALRIVQADPHAVDIAILDAEMPGLSGRETYTALRALSSALRIIFMSGLTSDSTEAISDNDWLFLPKPFGREQLLDAIAIATRPTPA